MLYWNHPHNPFEGNNPTVIIPYLILVKAFMNKPTTPQKARYEAINAIYKDLASSHGWAVSPMRTSRCQAVRTHDDPHDNTTKIMLGIKPLAYNTNPTIVAIDRAQNPLKQWVIDTDSITEMIHAVDWLLTSLEQDGIDNGEA